MAAQEKITFCRLCEQFCGLKVEVADGVITKIKADREHPITRGFACPKGLSFNEIRDDPDRVVTPLRRTDAGTFEPVTWDTALEEIGGRLRTVIDRHGPDAVGMYLGNPAGLNMAHTIWAKGMIDALGSPHFYTSGSQDTNSRFVASHFLYGSPFTVPIPDLPRTDFLLMVGANPLISHGSLVAGGLIRVDMQEIVDRGGRVVVVDPRRTETAERFEHIAVRPDGDAWLLLSLLHVIFAEGLTDPTAASVANGIQGLREAAEAFSPEEVEEHSGVPADVVRTLARDLATAPSAAIYGRVGACLGGYSTLVNFLLDAVSVVTGNLDRPGGSVFNAPPIDFWGMLKKQGGDTYATKHTRVGNYPEVGGLMPAGVMAEEMVTPGPGQIRAFFVTGGNPVLSVPNGPELREALDHLDLMVSIDLYVTETNRKAHYILPATTFLEREDVNTFVLAFQYRSFLQWTEAAVPPRGEAREEWTIYRDISAKIGLVPSSSTALQRLGWLARKLRPQLLLDIMLRTGPSGDRFGLRRGGLNRKRMLAQPSGLLLSEEVATGVLDKAISHRDGRVNLAPLPILAEVQRLLDEVQAEDVAGYPLRLFGRRELRSLNSWMHNSPRLNPRTAAPALLMHADDAERYGIADGGDVIVESAVGAITTHLKISDTVIPGSVCLPHGFGHNGDGGWRRANKTGGPSFNDLMASGAGALEPLAAMSILNGARVRVSPCADPSTTAD